MNDSVVVPHLLRENCSGAHACRLCSALYFGGRFCYGVQKGRKRQV